MKIKGTHLSIIIACVGTLLFTVLLIFKYINQGVYIGLMMALGVICIAVAVLPRLKELDIKNLRLTLNEIREAQEKLDETKKEVEEMYGGIERLRKAPLVLDEKKMQELGLEGGGLVMSSAVMRYPAGCIKRERERLARIFVNQKEPEKIAKAILDDSLDDQVFKWNGPEKLLDDKPVSVEERSRKE